jgi:hypothetical protein
MKSSERNSKLFEVARRLSATSLIAAMLIVPANASAGPLAELKSRLQQTAANVTELKNNVQSKVDSIKDQVEGLDGEALEQLMETVGSMLQYVKQAQAGYQNFVGADRCGLSSPCGVFRGKLRKLIETFVALPKELPFVEQVPPAVRQLEVVAKLVDHMPAPILFGAEKVLGNVFEEIQYRLELVRFAASQAPRFPTMSELSRASTTMSAPRGTKTSNAEPVADFPYCTAILDTGEVHVELLAKSLEHVGDFLWDLADMMEENKTVVVNAVAGGGTSVKNPAKGTTQLIGFVIKTIRQVVELKVAATASICALHGYKAP